jgi:hypothetical protein
LKRGEFAPLQHNSLFFDHQLLVFQNLALTTIFFHL